MRAKGLVLFLSLLCGLYSASASAQWADFWKTPEQRAQDAYSAEDYDYLLNHAPDENWQAAGQHGAGNFADAAKAYSDIAHQQDLEGNAEKAVKSLYNQGVSEAMAGQYEQALDTFDNVLERAPDFSDAEHNRAIVEQLITKQQEQQKQQQQNAEDGDQGNEDGDQGENQQPSDEQSDQQSSSAQNDTGQQNGQQSQDSDSQSQDESNDEQDAQDAQDAMAAEAASDNPGSDSQENSPGNVEPSEQPMSESEQATEQWLRRIPDDPAGLLRRKLEQSHRTEYPEVRDANEPW